MTKGYTKKQLREMHIHNPFNIMTNTGSKLFISYTGASYGRAIECATWRIIGNGFKTDPKGAWYNYGNKTFNVFCRADKEPKLKEAMAWVKETYGITEWERDVFGCYQIKGTLEKLANIKDGDQNKNGK
jgi:hypothetical protein